MEENLTFWSSSDGMNDSSNLYEWGSWQIFFLSLRGKPVKWTFAGAKVCEFTKMLLVFTLKKDLLLQKCYNSATFDIKVILERDSFTWTWRLVVLLSCRLILVSILDGTRPKELWHCLSLWFSSLSTCGAPLCYWVHCVIAAEQHRNDYICWPGKCTTGSCVTVQLCAHTQTHTRKHTQSLRWPAG